MQVTKPSTGAPRLTSPYDRSYLRLSSNWQASRPVNAMRMRMVDLSDLLYVLPTSNKVDLRRGRRNATAL